MRDPRRRRAACAAVLALALLLTGGCAAAPVDRAGGAAARDARILTFGQFGVSPGPALEAWASQVKALSDGSLQVEFKNQWQADRVDYEVATVDDVRTRRVDVAMVGARVFDRVGVTSFHALLAPMLVDSQALQSKVFAAGIPDEMAKHLQPARVVSLGTLPGPMRKMLGVSKPFLTPTDFAGAVIGIQDSALTQRTFTALGAVPRPVRPGAPLDGLDGYEQQLGSIAGNHYVDAAKYVTANLDLWPRPQVIITSPELRSSLSGKERSALDRAVLSARPVAERAVRTEDADSAAPLCRDRMKLPVASAQDLQALATAVAPVFDELAAEPATRAWLTQIRGLKADLAGEPDSQTCDANTPATVATAIPDGTYKREQIKGETVPGCPPDPGLTEPRSYLLLKLENGSVTVYSLSSAAGATPEVGWVGTFRVFRDRVDFNETATGIVLSAAWTLDGKQLTLGELRGGTCGDAIVWTASPWTKVT